VASVLPWHSHAQKSDKARPLFMTFFLGALLLSVLTTAFDPTAAED
jgi:hypothetical protein